VGTLTDASAAIGSVATQVATLKNDEFADVNADVKLELHLTVLLHIVAVSHALLKKHSGLHGIKDSRELSEATVAGVLEKRAARQAEHFDSEFVLFASDLLDLSVCALRRARCGRHLIGEHDDF